MSSYLGTAPESPLRHGPATVKRAAASCGSNHRRKVRFARRLLLLACAAAYGCTDVAGPATECWNRVHPVYWQTDARSLIQVDTPDAVVSTRADLIRFVWKGAGFPTALPQRVSLNVASPPELGALPNLLSANLIEVDSDDLTSVVYLLRPQQRDNRRLVIFHQGHSPGLDENGGKRTIEFFLGRGYSVLAFRMPLYGPNRGPGPGYDDPSAHDALMERDSPSLSPLRYFLEPVAIALNYALAMYAYRDVSMIGISGGGWTTTLYGALDPRIRTSIDVAGSYPQYLRTPPCGNESDMGDAEQYATQFYELAGYLDLYVLASFGEGRRMLQVINRFDPCCFSDLRYRTYADAVRQTVARLGAGEYQVFLDESHREHIISRHALETAILRAVRE